MANPTDNLKGKDRASLTLALPYGRHIFQGHLLMSVNTGSADPNQHIKFRSALMEGPMEGIEGIWYAGTGIASGSYTLHDGTQTTSPAAPFDLDFAHNGTAMIDVTLPVGMADADVKESPPEKLAILGKCLKVDDYDDAGVADGVSTFSANGARVVADLVHYRGAEPIANTDWEVWTAWRDFMAATETVDYTTLPDFDGIGLKGSYYTDTAFTTLILSRTDANIFFQSSDGAPALGQGDTFSVRWEGKIKAKTSGSYTFKSVHDDSIKIWIGDLTTPLIDQAAFGTHTATKTLTADTLYDIKIEWIDTGGNAACEFYWTPPTEVEHIVPATFLYPKAESKPRYETHALFESATDLDTAVRQILLMTNSVMQQADGKRAFYCIEQLTPVMALDSSHIKDSTFKWYRRERRGLRNHWEAIFRDLESQYLEVADPPVTVEYPEFQEAFEQPTTGPAIDLDNMTHWQAYKVLKHLGKFNTEMDIFCEFDGLASTYKLLPGDLVTIDRPALGWTAKQFLVVEATDYSAEETPDRRGFVCLEWS